MGSAYSQMTISEYIWLYYLKYLNTYFLYIIVNKVIWKLGYPVIFNQKYMSNVGWFIHSWHIFHGILVKHLRFDLSVDGLICNYIWYSRISENEQLNYAFHSHITWSQHVICLRLKWDGKILDCLFNQSNFKRNPWLDVIHETGPKSDCICIRCEV